jgi:tetratricopeptide (TPR) repeat protein
VANKRLCLFAAVAVLGLGRGVWGQVSEVDSLKGEIHFTPATIFRSEVTLSELHGTRNIAAVPVGGDGQFALRHVPYGEYRLTVLDVNQTVIHEQIVTIHDNQQPLIIYVKLPETERPPSGTVSAEQLLHAPTKKAFKAFLEAQKFSEAGEHQKAAEKLDKAIKLSPDYVNAWINLGAQHIYLKQYEQAIRELTHAGEISHPTAMTLSNIAFAQIALHRNAEGVSALRAAIRLDPSYAQAHYLLGAFLVQNARTRAEGIPHLEIAAKTMPAARSELEHLQRDSAQVVTRP